MRLPFYNPIDPTHPRIWPNYSLIMPVCAVGNIGQLACDLIISTLLNRRECQLIGRIYSPALMPVVGPNAYGPLGLPTTSTEIYESKKHKLVIIQQRTSYFKHLKDVYIEELVNWIKDSKFDQLIVLTSSFAQCNPDTSQLGDLTSCPIRSITTNLFDQSDKWKRLNIKPLPDKRTIKVVQDGLTFLPGSGLSKSLIKACEKAFIPAAFLVDFCSEGINIQDCYQVADMVDLYFNMGIGASKKLPPAAGSANVLTNVQDGGLISQNVCGDQYHETMAITRDWVEPYSWGLELAQY